MKKLVFALAAALVAGGIQAASLNWAASSYKAYDAEGSAYTSAAQVPSGVTLVLAYLGTTSSYSYDDAVAVQNGTATTSAASMGQPAAVKYSGAYDFSGTPGIANGQVYAVMLNDNGTLSQLKYADGTADDRIFTVSGYDPANSDDYSQTFAFATANYTVDKAATPSGVIPEPTSGLLMLVGLGALALRRRRR